MGGLSWWHWLIIIGAFVLLFGAKKLPDAARGVGRSLRILKSEVAAMHEQDEPTAVPVNDGPLAPAVAVPVVAVPAGSVPATHSPLTDVSVNRAGVRP
ncbi:Sec-independent protein translocase subunit TatA [Nakamurella sp.]|uniref:Sec-independent protein translocase subunit TatA n=1 Tax=Nakamurella sp. TaxID=1869182 RepID=UPI003B3BD642